MNIAVIGSRKVDESSWEYIQKRLAVYVKPEDIIISGGAIGIDKLAERYAKENDIPTQIFLPNYKKFGSKQAPHERNMLIVNTSDIVIAFWDGKSPGTRSVIAFAKRKNKRIVVYLLPKKFKNYTVPHLNSPLIQTNE